MSLRQKEKLVERRVTYALEIDVRVYIVENVPARVDEETGEQYFSPTTLERLRQIVLAPTEPSKMVETPVYEYQKRQERRERSFATPQTSHLATG